MSDITFVSVFTHNATGGNFCPIVLDAGAMDHESMMAVAQRFSHEAGFVQPAGNAEDDYSFRYYVPNHEMEMCGHATIGALWLLAEARRLQGPTVRIATRSGIVTGHTTDDGAGHHTVAITQPVGKVARLDSEAVADVLATLGLDRDDLADLPLQNAITSRVKTLVPLKNRDRLDALIADMPRVEATCRRIGSTGLYPYAISDIASRHVEARQFPRSSGYPEDAATGIAASALAFGLLAEGVVQADDQVIRVFQGRAMRRLSEIKVRIGFAGGHPIGCLIGGAVSLCDPPSSNGVS